MNHRPRYHPACVRGTPLGRSAGETPVIVEALTGLTRPVLLGTARRSCSSESSPVMAGSTLMTSLTWLVQMYFLGGRVIVVPVTRRIRVILRIRVLLMPALVSQLLG